MNKSLRKKKAAVACFLIFGLCVFFSCNVWNVSVPEYIKDQLNRGKDQGKGGGNGSGGGDPENSFMPHIVAVVPTAVDENSRSRFFQIYWYPDSGGGEIASVEINFNGEMRISNDWKNAGGTGTLQDPYIFDIDMYNGLLVDTPLTLTVSYYNDGRSPSAVENPRDANFPALPVYVSGTGNDYGILSESPAFLSDVFNFSISIRCFQFHT